MTEDVEKIKKGFLSIKKALYYHYPPDIVKPYMKTFDDAIALIIRQQEQIEALKQAAQSMMEGMVVFRG